MKPPRNFYTLKITLLLSKNTICCNLLIISHVMAPFLEGVENLNLNVRATGEKVDRLQGYESFLALF